MGWRERPGRDRRRRPWLWCGPTTVNLKKKDRKLGYFGYEEVLPKLRAELDRLIAERTTASATN